MKKYALKRIVTSLFTLLAILLVLFILMQLMPGSPFNDEKLNADQRAALYTKYGLDQPLPVQFVKYVGNMLKGDLGVSYNISKNTPISQLIKTRLPISISIGEYDNSINSGKSPLFILDGVPISSSDFNTLSPNDIESIDRKSVV